MMSVVETAACEISSAPVSIPYNLPVVNRDNTQFDEDFPRYRVYQSHPTCPWEIVDRDAYNDRGEIYFKSIFRSKSDWSADDIYTFLKHLNSRQ